MSVPNKSLGAFVPWLQLLQTLDIKPQSQALPAKIDCPVCGGSRFLIFSDNQLGGQWHYCPDCKSKGDMIHLAARVWEVDILSAVHRLSTLGYAFPTNRSIEELATNYKTHYIDYPKSVNSLWKKARETLRNTPGVEKKVQFQRLSLNYRIPGEWWAEGAGQIVGLTNTSDVNKCFQPNSSKVINDGHFSVSAQRIFKGRDWDEVLMLPFYDLPARIRMVLFIGRKGDPTEDYVYKSLFFLERSNEAGLFMHPATITSEGTVFAFGSAWFAAKLLLNHFGQKRAPVNVVAWHDSGSKRKTKSAWRMLRGRKIVLCSREITIEVLIQAALAEGHISTMCPDYSDQRTTHEWTRQFPILNRLNRIERGAVHWKTALEEFVRRGSDSDVETLMRKAKEAGLSLDFLISGCHEEVISRIKGNMHPGVSGQMAVVDSRTVEETVGGWIYHKARDVKEVISEAIFRIDKIIRHKKQDKTLYRGRILYQGNEIEFCESKKVFEVNPFRWIQDFLIDEGHGFMNYSKGVWARKAMQVSTAFKRPQVVEGITKIGWDKESASMVTPKFCIQWSGEVYSCSDLVPTERIPGYSLDPPEPLSPDDLSVFLDNTKENRCFWTIFATITAGILSPVLNREPKGIAYLGHDSGMDYVADMCGCQKLFLANENINETFSVECEHDWPAYVTTASKNGRTTMIQTYLALSQESRNCIVPVNEYQAFALSINPHWNVIRGIDTAVQPNINRSLLSSYIQYALKANLTLSRTESLPKAILADIISWLESMHLDATAVRMAKRSLGFTSNYSGLLADFLCKAISEGLTSIKPLEYVENSNSLVQTHHGIFITQKAVNLLTDTRSAPRIDLATAEKHLAKEGIIADGAKPMNQLGILVEESWLVDHIKNHRQRYTPGS